MHSTNHSTYSLVGLAGSEFWNSLECMLSQRISGVKLRRIREQRGLKVAAVADAVGRTPSNIYKIEQGKAQPSSEVYLRLKTLLDIDDIDIVDERSEAGNAA